MVAERDTKTPEWPTGPYIKVLSVEHGQELVNDLFRQLLDYHTHGLPPVTLTMPKPVWLSIETAPKETEILVGRYVNDDWRICQSGFYYDRGNEFEGERPYWYWSCDWDKGGVTDDDGPTHWMPLPEAP